MIYRLVAGGRLGIYGPSAAPWRRILRVGVFTCRADSTSQRCVRDTSSFGRSFSAPGVRPLGREAAIGHCGCQSYQRRLSPASPSRRSCRRARPPPSDWLFILPEPPGRRSSESHRTNADAAGTHPGVSRASRTFPSLRQAPRGPGRDGVPGGSPPQRLPACHCPAQTLPLYPGAVLPADKPLLPQARGLGGRGPGGDGSEGQGSPVHLCRHRPRRAKRWTPKNEAGTSPTVPGALAIISLNSRNDPFDRQENKFREVE